MRTEQIFFKNIVNLNAFAFKYLDENIGDLNKDSELSADYYEKACKIVGNTVTSADDLTSLFIGTNFDYQKQFSSDITETLRQSIQNAKVGVSYTTILSQKITDNSYFDIPIHFSTSIFEYNSSISSTFLSAQIYQVPISSISINSSIIVPYNFNLSGNFSNSYFFDIPCDFAVYGLNNFNGNNFNNSNLISFDYAWSYANQNTNLIINFNFLTTVATNYYLIFYWGNRDSTFVQSFCTSVNNIAYSGTNNFIQNLGTSISNITAAQLNKFTTRKNFWNKFTPYTTGIQSNSYLDSNFYLWAADRINLTLNDGVEQIYQPPEKYNLEGEQFLNGFSTDNNFKYLYFDSATSGIGSGQGVNANFQLKNLFESNYHLNFNLKNFIKTYQNEVPLYHLVLQKSINKQGVGSFCPYIIYENKQLSPAAFTKAIESDSLWNFFAGSIYFGKLENNILQGIIDSYLLTLENFVASYLFGAHETDPTSFFEGGNLTISKSAFKIFSQPIGYNDTDPINFEEFEEKSIYRSTNIVPSREFIKFNQGKLELLNFYNLPFDSSFEIFKPISFVCNGIDPFEQGTGLAYDYTLNLNFTYNNQNNLQKIIYLMASKYLIAENDYNNKILNNEFTDGYFWLADPDSTDTSAYSVSSINDFRLYGYSALIPDLKDGVTRPILCRAFSPKDSSRYTYEEFINLLQSQGITNPDDINRRVEQYLSEGNTFLVVNLNTFSNQFNNLSDISICAANYINLFETPRYWNEIELSFSELIQETDGQDSRFGFLDLTAQIIVAKFNSPAPPNTFQVSVGNDCSIKKINVISLGSSQVQGNYTMPILPDNISAGAFTTEQPAIIKYSINQNGLLDSASVQILNTGGNFYYDFNKNLNAPLSDINGFNAELKFEMDNTCVFGVTTSISLGSSIIFSMAQSTKPGIGYFGGFNLNPNAFKELGYTFSDFDVKIFIQDLFTVDSFLIAESGKEEGFLENISNFTQPSNNFSQINFINGGQTYNLYEDSIINAIVVPYSYINKQITNITLVCKIIQFNNFVPAGDIQLFVYSATINNTPDFENVIAKSDPINVTTIDSVIFSELVVPLTFNFFNNNLNPVDGSGAPTIYFVQVKQNLSGCVLALKGTFSGITTSSFSISSSSVANDVNDIVIFGNIGTSTGVDLDLSGPILFNVLPASVATSISTTQFYIRKNVDFNITNTENNITLSISSGPTNYLSDSILLTAIGTAFTPITFTFNQSIQTSLVNSAKLIFSSPVLKNQVYTSRVLSSYDFAISAGSTSFVSFGNNISNFNFTFNKLFGGTNAEIFAAFNFKEPTQFGLAKPNNLRTVADINEIDGYWSFKSKKINKPLSIYPRAYFSVSTVIGTSQPQYQYLGYTHDIYTTVGYTSSGVYEEETFTLKARPNWKTTWMTRNNQNYKNFEISNVFVQSYFDTIFYLPGTASTIIGSESTPKSAIFEGVFTPSVLANDVIISARLGTSSGVQVYLNNGISPVIDTFSVIPSSFTSTQYTISSSILSSGLNFRILYFTLGTPSIEMYWNLGVAQTFVLIGPQNSSTVPPAPIAINGGATVDSLVFFNVTQSDPQNLVNNGFPTGDSFVIRSS
jgi:hypothetical protein